MGGDIGGAAQAAAAIIVAGINQITAIWISERQYKIAKGYLKLAQELRDYWKNTFVPREVQYVSEAFSTPPYTPQYMVTAGRYVAAARQQFKNAQDDAIRCISRYCTGMQASLARDMAIAEAVAVGNATNYAYRYEEARKEVLDERTWAHKTQALSLGRNLVAQSAQLDSLASGALNGMADAAAKGTAGAMRALGYGDQAAQRAGNAGGAAAMANSVISNMEANGGNIRSVGDTSFVQPVGPQQTFSNYNPTSVSNLGRNSTTIQDAYSFASQAPGKSTIGTFTGPGFGDLYTGGGSADSASSASGTSDASSMSE